MCTIGWLMFGGLKFKAGRLYSEFYSLSKTNLHDEVFPDESCEVALA